jgi:hypothetical protein
MPASVPNPKFASLQLRPPWAKFDTENSWFSCAWFRSSLELRAATLKGTSEPSHERMLFDAHQNA